MTVSDAQVSTGFDPEEDSAGIGAFDAEFRLTHGNDALRRMTAAALPPGAPLLSALAATAGTPPDKVRALSRHLRKHDARPFDFETEDQRTLEFSLRVVDGGGRILRVADVTRARRLQVRIDRQAALLRLLGEAVDSAANVSPQAFPHFLDGLTRIAGCHSGLIAEAHDAPRGKPPQLVPVAAIGPWAESDPPMPPVLRRALAGNGSPERNIDALDAPGLGHCLVLPVTARGRLLGAIVLSGRPERFDDILVSTLTMVLSTAAALFAQHTAERHRRQAANDLRASQDRVRTIFDTIREGVVIAAANGAIIGFNAAAERLFGHRLERVLGRNAALLCAPGGPDDAFVTETAGDRHEVLAVRKDGQTFPAEISVSRLESGADGMFIAIVQDISERKRIARMQSELIATVGHDLRTPLTSILGALRLINTGALPPERGQEMLRIAERNGQRLMRLVNDLLDLERINAGMIAFAPAPTDLGAVLRQSIESHRPLSEAKGLSIDWGLPSDPLWVHGDADRLSQIAVNIFGNAVRFSPPGGVVSIRAHAAEGTVRVEFADQGPGIPPDFLPVMFDRFQQVAERVRKTEGEASEGSGLGLSIVRALVELHGGRVGAVSPPGAGATVFFELPGEAARI